MPKRFVAGVLLGVLFFVGCERHEERAVRARSEAVAALESGERRAAVEALERLRAASPDTTAARLELAGLLVRAGEAPQALWVLEAALLQDPSDEKLRLALASTALLVQDPRRAGEVLRGIPPDSENDLAATLLRAHAELELGNEDAAFTHLEYAAARYPDRPEATLARLQTLLRERRKEEALALAEEASRSESLDEAARRRFELVAARLAAEEGNLDAALARLDTLLERDALDTQVWTALVGLLVEKNRGQEARQRLEAASATHPDNALLQALLAGVDAASGRPEDAEAALVRAVALSDTPSSRLTLARLYVARGDAGAAVRSLEEAIEGHPDSAMLRMHLTEARIDAGDLAGAESALEAFVKLAPADPHGEYLKARLELTRGDAATAEASLRALVARLDTPYTQFWLGRTLEAQGDLEGAARRFGLAFRRNPKDPAAAGALYAVSVQRGDWASAGFAAQALARANPRSPEAFEALAEVKLRLGHAKEAEVIARKLREAAPDRSSAAILLARSLTAQGKLAEAERVLAEAVAGGGSSPELEAERGVVMGASGRPDQALELVREAAEEHPEAAAPQRALAMLYFAAGDGAQGAAATQRAIALDPENLTPLALQARFLASRGEWDQAQLAAERHLAERPADAEMHFLLGAVHEGAGDEAAAARAYERAVEQDPGHVSARNNLSLILGRQGETDAALEHAQAAYAEAPANAHVLDTLGWLYLQKGLVGRAVAFLEQAREANPAGAGPQLHLALAYQAAERPAEARVLLKDLTGREGLDPALRSETNAALQSMPD